MNSAPATTDRRKRGQHGVGMLDLCAALALSAAATGAVLSGLRPLACALRVEAARTAVIDTLLQARREAYAGETSVTVEARRGSGSVVLRPSGLERSLGPGVTLIAGPADGTVRFRSSGLADNATLTVACSGSTASVVVNQRGVIR